MNKHKPKLYLAGGMEKDDNLGAGWRDKLTPFLDDLGFDIHDPVKFEAEKLKNFKVNRLPETFINKWDQEIPCRHWHQLKEAKDKNLYDRFLRYMRQIIRYDLKVVNDMDVLIVNWSERTRSGGGSYAEITESFMKNIPVYAVITTDCPAWIQACFSEWFNSFDELKAFLQEEYGE